MDGPVLHYRIMQRKSKKKKFLNDNYYYFDFSQSFTCPDVIPYVHRKGNLQNIYSREFT